MTYVSSTDINRLLLGSDYATVLSYDKLMRQISVSGALSEMYAYVCEYALTIIIHLIYMRSNPLTTYHTCNAGVHSELCSMQLQHYRIFPQYEPHNGLECNTAQAYALASRSVYHMACLQNRHACAYCTHPCCSQMQLLPDHYCSEHSRLQSLPHRLRSKSL